MLKEYSNFEAPSGMPIARTVAGEPSHAKAGQDTSTEQCGQVV